MKDLNVKFTKFYNEYVRLSDIEINSLREKKKLNIDRLKAGLTEYNEEKGTNYRLVDDIEQGSVAMRTVTQHDQKEYDIDVAIIFNASNIPESTKEIKAIVENALQRKCSAFKAAPEAKTNAVRIDYASGYHIDFAIYRRETGFVGGFKYEHCSNEWRERDPRAINSWFNKENESSDKNIRKVVRLLKMFCKSHSGWLMPGGLIQTILVSECIQNEDRLDKTFYETIKKVRERLETNKEVYNPTMGVQHSILYTPKDHQRVKNLSTRLTNALKKLEILFDDKCTEDQAMEAWKTIFNHNFWGESIQKSASYESLLESRNQILLDINVDVLLHGKIKVPLDEYQGKLPKGCKLSFSVEPRVKFTKVEWIVHNYGDESTEHKTHTQYGERVEENTLYRGNHTMTCQVFEGARLMAKKVIPINIR